MVIRFAQIITVSWANENVHAQFFLLNLFSETILPDVQTSVLWVIDDCVKKECKADASFPSFHHSYKLWEFWSDVFQILTVCSTVFL